MNKPSVAILHYSCPPIIGGVEFVIEAHARLFAEAGYTTRLIVGKGGTVHPKVRTVIIPEIVSSGGPVGDVLKAFADGKVSPKFEKAVEQTEKKLLRALRTVDVCMMHNVLTMHFNLVLTAALANIMKRGCGTRFIGWTHDATFGFDTYKSYHRDEYPWNLIATRLPGCNYCAISAQRQRELKKLIGVPANECPVIQDGVSANKLLGLTPNMADFFREERLRGMDVVALTPTRVLRRKNLQAGIDIVAALKKQGRRVRWMITGAPDPHHAAAMEYFYELTAYRKKKRVQNEVIFLCERFKERVSNEDLRSLFAVSDMLIFPSAQEGFGIPVLEGGLAGLVLVLSDIPAFKEIAGRNAVYIHLKKYDPANVAERAMKALAKNQQLMMRKKIIANYSWDAVFSKKIEIAVRKPGTMWQP